MKTCSLLAVALLIAFASLAQPAPPTPPRPPVPLMPPGSVPPPPAAEPAREPVNYLIRVEWTEPKGEPKSLQVLTAEGSFNLNTIQKNSVKINNNDIPVTLKFSGSIREINEDKGRLQLFLGRTVPYVTGSYGNGPNASSSYSQMSVGLDSTFIVKFGKPVVVQSDENGEISVLVKRVEE